MVGIFCEVLIPYGLWVRIVFIIQQIGIHTTAETIRTHARFTFWSCAIGKITYQRGSIRVATVELCILTWHFANDISSGSTDDGILVTIAVTNSCIILHVAYNSSRNAFVVFVGSHCAILDIAVGDDSVTLQTSGNTAHTSASLHARDGHFLHTEASHCTGNHAKDTRIVTSSYFTIMDDMSTAIIMAVKYFVSAIAYRCPSTTIQVNIDGLEEVDTGNLLAIVTEIPYLFQIRKTRDEEGISGQPLSRECEGRTNGIIRIFRTIEKHTPPDAVKHRIEIFSSLVDILIPSNAKCRFIVQQPCHFTACHFGTHAMMAVRRIINATLAGHIAFCGEAVVNLSLTPNQAGNASGKRTCKIIISPMTMAHAGNINHLTYQATRIGGFHGIVGSIAVCHRARRRNCWLPRLFSSGS